MVHNALIRRLSRIRNVMHHCVNQEPPRVKLSAEYFVSYHNIPFHCIAEK